jgi:DNA-binding MarR family transcriptional regulator
VTAYADVERELAVLLRRARAWNRDVAATVHPDLQPAAYALLSRVDELGSVRASDLSDYFGLDKGGISRQVALLERIGLVSREPDPDDGRAQLLVVTPGGQARLAEAKAGRRQLVRQQLGRWPDGDVDALAELLGRYNRAIDAAIGRAAALEGVTGVTSASGKG